MKNFFPFLKKRDVVVDIKNKPKKPKSKSTRSKYALIIEDDFGYKKIEYFICTERKIQQLIFKKYILLKRKATKDENFFGKDLKPKSRVIETKKLYEVRLNVGFKLFHRIYYEKLDNNTTHIVTKQDMHTTYYLGYFDRKKAFKVAIDTSLKDSRYLKNEDEDEENDKIRKVFFRNSLQIRFNYWYHFNYEYDEWQEHSFVTLSKEIKFKSIY